jgi:hypothetical protein
MLPPNMAPPQAAAQTIMPTLTGGSGSEKAENWDESYINVLGTQDPRQLRELLARSNPEIVMPLNAHGPLSQAVVLTLIHRVRLVNFCVLRYSDQDVVALGLLG